MSSSDKLPAAQGLRYFAGALASGRLTPGAVELVELSPSALHEHEILIHRDVLDERR